MDTECPEFRAGYIPARSNDQEEGFLFEVNLEYPSYLHDQHDNLPHAPVHQEIKRDLLSPYQKNLADDLGMKVRGEKLCLTQEDK